MVIARTNNANVIVNINACGCDRVELRPGSVVLLDNFKSHVTEASQVAFDDDLRCHLCAIPANSTSTIQPLDVGVMGPFKAALRRLWLEEEDGAMLETAAQKRRRAILRSVKAWSMISADTVRKSFTKAIPQK